MKKCRSFLKPHEILCLLRIEAGVVETYLLTILGQGWEMVAFGLILYLKYELGPLQGKGEQELTTISVLLVKWEVAILMRIGVRCGSVGQRVRDTGPGGGESV